MNEQLVIDHLHLVRLTRERVVPQVPAQVDPEDLISAGYLGLLHAAARFDPDRGAQFPTYAITCIRGALLNYLRDDDWMTRADRQRAKAGEAVPERLAWHDVADTVTAPEPEEAGPGLEPALALALSHALQALDPALRDAVQAVHGDALSLKAAAARLNCTERTVRRREQSGLAALRQALPERP